MNCAYCGHEAKVRYRVNEKTTGISYKYVYCEYCNKSYSMGWREIDQNGKELQHEEIHLNDDD